MGSALAPEAPYIIDIKNIQQKNMWKLRNLKWFALDLGNRCPSNCKVRKSEGENRGLDKFAQTPRQCAGGDSGQQFPHALEVWANLTEAKVVTILGHDLLVGHDDTDRADDIHRPCTCIGNRILLLGGRHVDASYFLLFSLLSSFAPRKFETPHQLPSCWGKRTSKRGFSAAP